MLNTQQIIDQVKALTQGCPIWLAYSGGIDSHMLLHLLATASLKFESLQVVHVNHGLQKAAGEWAKHCQQVSEQLQLPFHLLNVKVDYIDELGIEAAARQARYQAIKSILPDDGVLLTAQHQQDQAETLLLQLLRGAGPKGLAAMAKQSVLFGLNVIRPLLDVSQADIEAYVVSHQLKWIEDPSNSNTHWNRNYIRHTVWPLIEKRWPGASKTLSRSSRHCAETEMLLAELAEQDLGKLVVGTEIKVDELLHLSAERQRNALRYFIQLQKLQLPPEIILQNIIDEVCLAKEDAEPFVHWKGAEARRHQGLLYLLTEQKKPSKHNELEVKNTNTLTINDQVYLVWQQDVEYGLKLELIKQGLSLKFRQGGERIQLHQKKHHQTLKNLFQEWQVPPWQRDRIPLLFSGDELVAVIGYGVAEQARASVGEPGFFPVLKTYK